MCRGTQRSTEIDRESLDRSSEGSFSVVLVDSRFLLRLGSEHALTTLVHPSIVCVAVVFSLLRLADTSGDILSKAKIWRLNC